jgi:hypothetical protein
VRSLLGSVGLVYPSYSISPIAVRYSPYYIPHVTDQKRDYAAVIRAQGAEFCGVQRGPRGTVVLFADPESRATLAVPEPEFSSQTVSRRLQESRRAFALDAEVQKSLC